jgi:hypothetical protein
MTAVLLYACVCTGAVIHVPGDSATIQAGINGALPGDTVLVADGIYTGDGNHDIDFDGKAVVVKSENGAQTTIIDCEDAYHGFLVWYVEDSAATLDGFTIQNCVTGLWVRQTMLQLLNCTIKGCISSQGMSGEGGGIYGRDSWLAMDNCVLLDNEARGAWNSYGGGMHILNSSLEIRECLFQQNVAANGGGAFIGACDLSIENSTFRDNLATWAGSEISEVGGALYIAGCDSAVIRGCLFELNDALRTGSGIYAASFSQFLIENTTFAYNRKTAFALWSGDLTLQDCIIAFGNRAPFSTNTVEMEFACCNIYGNIGGDWVGDIAQFEGINGNFSADPLFCDIAVSDFHLKTCSPCAPENNTCGVLIGAFDVGCTYLCGDADADGQVDVDDAVRVYHYIFGLLPEPEPLESGDVDCSGGIDMDDVVYLVAYIFLGGPEPCA